jgi:ribosomal protein S18 acetylase RimI-like enzyme
VSAGLQELQRRGAKTARLGTSSENKAMQQLAEALGFRIVSERVWFSRLVN